MADIGVEPGVGDKLGIGVEPGIGAFGTVVAAAPVRCTQDSAVGI